MNNRVGKFNCSLCGTPVRKRSIYYVLPAGKLCVDCGEREELPPQNIRDPLIRET